jgi:hypothetical protein
MKQMESIAYQSVMAIKDQHLLVAVAACVELADELGPTTDLAGSWILDRARTRIPGLWLPNFKPFVTHNILIRVGGSRGGQRAYYRLVDLEGTRRALIELGVPFRARTAAAAS